MAEPNAVSQCIDAATSAPDSILNYIITLALVLSYFPQYHRIISRGSTHGISPYFVLLSTMYATSALANILLLESVRNGYDCCRIGNYHSINCFTALTSTAQAALQWLGSIVLFMIYLIFYPRPPVPDKPPKRHSLSKTDLVLSLERREIEASMPYPRLPRVIGTSSLILVLFILGPPLLIIFSPHLAAKVHQSLIQDWYLFTSTLSLVTATLQYLPQMYTTLRLKHHHSLSMIMLTVQIPVLLLLGISNASEGDKSPHEEDRYLWVRWMQGGEIARMNQIVSGSAEGLLLALCLYLYLSQREFGRDNLDGDEDAEEEYITSMSMGEETPLLPGRNRTDLQTSQRFGRWEFMGR